MKIIQSIFYAVIIMTILASCRKEETEAFTDSPIIEAYLQTGNVFNVKISRQIPFTSDVEYSNDDINNLSIQVEYNGSVHTLTPIGSGEYVDSSIIVSYLDKFNLNFTFNEKNVSAYTYVPTKPANVELSSSQIYVERIDSGSFGGPPGGTQTDPIEITWDNPDNSYYLILVENIETTLDPIRDFGDEDPPDAIFRKTPTSDDIEQIRTIEFQYFGTHRVIIFHVLPDYATLYDQNSASSLNLTNPSSSIKNGYGIFTGLNSDTLWIEVIED